MKHLLLLLIAVFLTSAAASAMEWHPYASIGGVLDAPFPSTTSTYNPRGWDPVYLSPGMGFEAGVVFRQTEWYLAYHSSNSPTTQDDRELDRYLWLDAQMYHLQTFTSDRTSWSERRIFLGFRQHLIARSNANWIPFMGGALDLGKSRFRQSHYERVQESIAYPIPNGPDTTEESSSSLNLKGEVQPGVTAEFGIAAAVTKSLQALVVADLHFYAASFNVMRRSPTETWNETIRYTVLSPSLMLQVRYLFPANPVRIR